MTKSEALRLRIGLTENATLSQIKTAQNLLDCPTCGVPKCEKDGYMRFLGEDLRNRVNLCKECFLSTDRLADLE